MAYELPVPGALPSHVLETPSENVEREGVHHTLQASCLKCTLKKGDVLFVLVLLHLPTQDLSTNLKLATLSTETDTEHCPSQEM